MLIGSLVFQSTLPREERLLIIRSSSIALLFQSTLPREERRWSFCITHLYFHISIHAPTRGATYHICNKAHSLLFQSTLPREERRYSIIRNNCTALDFNPRSHERSDTTPSLSSGFPQNFNPRSHERSDSSTLSVSSMIIGFQSTIPREERLLSHLQQGSFSFISIHAPTRGATERELTLTAMT